MEIARRKLINDLTNNIDFTYKGWSPTELKVWRAGEAGKRVLPYIAVDYINTSDKRFSSLGDVVGRINDLRLEYAYCELELVTVTIYTEKYHDGRNIRGRDFANWALQKVRKRILAYWNDILVSYNASIDRKVGMPIKDLSMYDGEVGTRIHEYELTVYLRTDVRWYKDMPEDDVTEERAEKAYVVMQDINNIRIDTS